MARWATLIAVLSQLKQEQQLQHAASDTGITGFILHNFSFAVTLQNKCFRFCSLWRCGVKSSDLDSSQTQVTNLMVPDLTSLKKDFQSIYCCY